MKNFSEYYQNIKWKFLFNDIILENDLDIKKIISTKIYGPYYVNKEILKDGQDTEMISAYSNDDKYIGDPKIAKTLVNKYGIKNFYVSDPNNTVCSIGFNPDKKIWYGWSHRAICGFTIGDKIFNKKYGNDKTPFIKHGKEDIKNIDQAKQAAINFAKYVS
jgi:hypothetical protein